MEEGEELSILDLIEYYEAGPVIKERTPDINRVMFAPDENVLSGKPAQIAGEPGKNSTSKLRLISLHKEALGLFDVPAGASPGMVAFRGRDSYQIDGEDSEASHRGGFGGPSIIDVEEDKPPNNIDRKKKEKPDHEEWNFFDFLMSSAGYNDFGIVKKEYYIADKGRVWMKKSTGSIYFSKIGNSNNILLINVKEDLSKSQKLMLENSVNMDNSISNRKKEAYKEILYNKGLRSRNE
jgi:hypothetical protein